MPRALIYDGYGNPLKSVQVGDHYHLDVKNTALEGQIDGIDFAEETTLSSLESSIDVLLSTRAAEDTQELIRQYLDDVMITSPDGDKAFKSVDIAPWALIELLVRGEMIEALETSHIYKPGFTRGAEITVTAGSPVTIATDTNDKFTLEVEGTMPGGEEVTIPSGTYESGSSFVDAIITGLENAMLDDYVTVVWDGNDDGRIEFVSNDVGAQSWVMISEPGAHSALADMGFDDVNLVTTNEGQATTRNLLQETEMIVDNQLSGDQQTKSIGRNQELVDGEATFANNEDPDTEKSFDVPIPEVLTANNEVMVVVDNPSPNTALTVEARVAWEAIDNNEKKSRIQQWTVSAEDSVGEKVQGLLVGNGGEIIISNDSALGAEDGFSAYMQAILL